MPKATGLGELKKGPCVQEEPVQVAETLAFVPWELGDLKILDIVSIATINYQYYFSLTSKRGYSSSWFWAISPFSINDTIVTVVNSSQASLWLSDSSDYLIAKLFFPWSFGTSLKAYTVAAQIRGLYRSQCINTHLPFSRGGICEAIFGGENYKSHELL